jgi:hypothetical protein
LIYVYVDGNFLQDKISVLAVVLVLNMVLVHHTNHHQLVVAMVLV